jgi:hypothetical protein
MSTRAKAARIDTLQSPEMYRASRENVFPSAQSLEWAMRANRDRLVRAGALSMPNGRWLISPARFDAELAAIGRERAARTLERATCVGANR